MRPSASLWPPRMKLLLAAGSKSQITALSQLFSLHGIILTISKPCLGLIFDFLPGQQQADVASQVPLITRQVSFLPWPMHSSYTIYYTTIATWCKFLQDQRILKRRQIPHHASCILPGNASNLHRTNVRQKATRYHKTTCSHDNPR